MNTYDSTEVITIQLKTYNSTEVITIQLKHIKRILTHKMSLMTKVYFYEVGHWLIFALRRSLSHPASHYLS